MKKLGLLLFAFVAFSVNAFSQKSLAHFNTSDADCYKIIDNNTNVVIKFSVDAKDASQKDAYVATFQKIKEVSNVETVSFDGSLATYKLTITKDGFFNTIEKTLVLASIFEVEYNGKKMSTKELGPIAKAEYEAVQRSRTATK
jgi:hypothetical protein